ncbi:hypothetical protein GE09DRAFT_92874 [Coniochaeta sp. 2T2.1]|nr:hypothetical protein GE09DRAFT_92874 [Coniochaeta sp. 2T2.1]
MSEPNEHLPAAQAPDVGESALPPMPVAAMNTGLFSSTEPDAQEETKQQGYPWSYTQLCLLSINEQHNLDYNHRNVLKTVSDWKQCLIDSQTMARCLRQSVHLQNAAVNIATRMFVGVAGNDSLLGRRLLQTKLDCMEAATIASEYLFSARRRHSVYTSTRTNMPFIGTPGPDSMPFLKFPAEIRRMIYFEYLKQATTGVGSVLSHARGMTTCTHCHTPPYRNSKRLNIELAFSSTQVAAEVLPVLYRMVAVRYYCTCWLARDLTANRPLRANIIRVHVSWVGPRSHMAFALLARCRRLEGLDLSISMSTTLYPTARESLMQSWGLADHTRLCDALGFDELVRLRDLGSIDVRHVDASLDLRRTETERLRLELMLRKHCLCSGEDEEDTDYEDHGDDDDWGAGE